MAGGTLHRRLELALEQGYDDGLVEEFVFAPGQVGCGLVIQVVIFLLFVSFPIVRLKIHNKWVTLEICSSHCTDERQKTSAVQFNVTRNISEFN